MAKEQQSSCHVLDPDTTRWSFINRAPCREQASSISASKQPRKLTERHLLHHHGRESLCWRFHQSPQAWKAERGSAAATSWADKAEDRTHRDALRRFGAPPQDYNVAASNSWSSQVNVTGFVHVRICSKPLPLVTIFIGSRKLLLFLHIMVWASWMMIGWFVLASRALIFLSCILFVLVLIPTRLFTIWFVLIIRCFIVWTWRCIIHKALRWLHTDANNASNPCPLKKRIACWATCILHIWWCAWRRTSQIRGCSFACSKNLLFCLFELYCCSFSSLQSCVSSISKAIDPTWTCKQLKICCKIWRKWHDFLTILHRKHGYTNIITWINT